MKRKGACAKDRIDKSREAVPGSLILFPSMRDGQCEIVAAIVTDHWATTVPKREMKYNKDGTITVKGRRVRPLR